MPIPCLVNKEKRVIVKCSSYTEANRFASVIMAMSEEEIWIYGDIDEIDPKIVKKCEVISSDYFET